MVGIINKLAANTLSPEEREFLNTGIMLALRKPNSNKLRPIVIGPTLVKLAWKAMIKVVCNALLSQHQLIGRRPFETAIHRAVKELRNGNTLLSFDASNAFNEICRSAIHDCSSIQPSIQRSLSFTLRTEAPHKRLQEIKR
jgi:hypothetical protein